MAARLLVFSCLSESWVGSVGGYPYPVDGKIATILGKNKEVSVSENTKGWSNHMRHCGNLGV